MIKDNDAPQEQRTQEESEPASPQHDDLEVSETEAISGGVPADIYTSTSHGIHPN